MIKGTRVFILATSSLIILVFLYLALRNNSLSDNELSTIYVTLQGSPKYRHYKIKSSDYSDIILKTKEYKREFKITAMEYKATDHRSLQKNIVSGEKIELKVKKSEVGDLNGSTIWNNYNNVYGLGKNGQNYIEIELRNKFSDEDSKWSYFFIFIGLVMLPYAFIKRKPLISMDKAITTVAVIGLLIMLFTNIP
ncbi:hypothetical protein NZ698_07605 [Chryseobacterium sp. PBS4-4]|uniref:DUF3592 domain-containing protein n=1 Tax=Chryseobacterium edaphi TaxID=2976532 RepID=A0ABT2W6M3_9FLAO|nr:hypothetical protein [Chryseobacterium edaphi]MCU7617059.1 hypothetical protein [Chryseobacterium edaphi]